MDSSLYGFRHSPERRKLRFLPTKFIEEPDFYMITLTSKAVKQMELSAEQGDMQRVPVRIAIQEQEDGSFHYAMGYDKQRLPGDVFINVEEVSLVVAKKSQELAEGMTIDYVELEPGKYEFIFLNPNDPTYVAPRKK